MVEARAQRAHASLRLPSRWSFPLLSLLLLAVAAAALLHSSANSDTFSDAATTSTTTTIYGNHLRPLLEEKDGTQTLNVYGPGGRIVAQIVRDADGNEEVRYLLGDHLGSTRLILHPAGNPIGTFDYSPFGQTSASGTSADSVRPRYTGQRHDPALDTYHFPARAYDPQTGCFLSVDPKRVNHSPYIYASDAPVNRVDPTGGEDLAYYFVDGFWSVDQLLDHGWLGYGEIHMDLLRTAGDGLPSYATSHAEKAVLGFDSELAFHLDVFGDSRSPKATIVLGAHSREVPDDFVPAILALREAHLQKFGEEGFLDFRILAHPDSAHLAREYAGVLARVNPRSVEMSFSYALSLDERAPSVPTAPSAPLYPVVDGKVLGPVPLRATVSETWSTLDRLRMATGREQLLDYPRLSSSPSSSRSSSSSDSSPRMQGFGVHEGRPPSPEVRLPSPGGEGFLLLEPGFRE